MSQNIQLTKFHTRAFWWCRIRCVSIITKGLHLGGMALFSRLHCRAGEGRIQGTALSSVGQRSPAAWPRPLANGRQLQLGENLVGSCLCLPAQPECHQPSL